MDSWSVDGTKLSVRSDTTHNRCPASESFTEKRRRNCELVKPKDCVGIRANEIYRAV